MKKGKRISRVMESQKKLDITSVAINEEEIDDLGLSKMLKAVDKTRKVSKASVIAKLMP
jgi:hypothetical protein